jgi:hypothetical protein
MKGGALVDHPRYAELIPNTTSKLTRSKVRSPIVLCHAKEACPKASNMGRLVRQLLSRGGIDLPVSPGGFRPATRVHKGRRRAWNRRTVDEFSSQ